MKILFTTNHAYLPQRVGGSESSTHDLCTALRARGTEVAVLSRLIPWRQINGKRHLATALQRIDGMICDDSLGYPVFRALNPERAVARIVAEQRPTIAFVQANRPLSLAARFTALSVPTIVYIRDAFFDDLGGPVTAGAGVRYVATSAALAERFARAFGITPAQIPPLVRSERYRVEPRGRNVTFVCPHRGKGAAIALELARRRPDLPFVFAQSWPMHFAWRWYVKWRVRRLGNATWRAPTADARPIYEESRILLVPSLFEEGWGRVVSEAQVSAIPVLASNRGGLPEAVGRGGILVDPAAGIDAWLDGLSRLCDDPIEYQRLAEQAREHSLRPEFQPEAIVAQLESLFAEVIGDRRSPTDTSLAGSRSGDWRSTKRHARR